MPCSRQHTTAFFFFFLPRSVTPLVIINYICSPEITHQDLLMMGLMTMDKEGEVQAEGEADRKVAVQWLGGARVVLEVTVGALIEAGQEAERGARAVLAVTAGALIEAGQEAERGARVVLAVTAAVAALTVAGPGAVQGA